MKNTKHHDAVLEWITANPNMTIDSIKEGNPKVSHIMLKSVIKDLQEEGIIASNNEDGGYVITGSTKKEDAEPKTATKESKQKITSTVGAKAVMKVEKKKKEEEELGPPTFTGRDNSKYDFAGQKNLAKGKLVLAIVKKYVEENPKTTLSKIQEVFDSEKIQPRYGVVNELSKAKAHTKSGKDRYFLKAEDIIKVGTIKIAVTNQWGLSTLTLILKIAKDLGYKISVTK